MRTNKYKYVISAFLVSAALSVTSCTGDLDTVPLDKDELVSEVVFGSDIAAYQQSIAKLYAGFVIGGNSGGDSDQDWLVSMVVARLLSYVCCGICRS